MVGLITEQLRQNNWLNQQSNWLLDGFPRTINQATELSKIIGRSADLNLVVELDVDQKSFWTESKQDGSMYQVEEYIVWIITLLRFHSRMM